MTSDSQHDYWNRVANTKVFTHPIDSSLLGRYINKNAVIVDYGCGYGRLVSALRDAGYTNVSGFDTSEELINRGKNDGVPNLFFLDDLDKIPVEDSSVDCILLFAVLTCIPANRAQKALVDLLHRKLKKGGVIYISDYYLQNDATEVGRYTYLNDDNDNFGVFSLPEGVTFRHHTPEWIASLLKSFDIREEKAIEVRTMNGHSADAFQLVGQRVMGD